MGIGRGGVIITERGGTISPVPDRVNNLPLPTGRSSCTGGSRLLAIDNGRVDDCFDGNVGAAKL